MPAASTPAASDELERGEQRHEAAAERERFDGLRFDHAARAAVLRLRGGSLPARAANAPASSRCLSSAPDRDRQPALEPERGKLQRHEREERERPRRRATPRSSRPCSAARPSSHQAAIQSPYCARMRERQQHAVAARAGGRELRAEAGARRHAEQPHAAWNRRERSRSRDERARDARRDSAARTPASSTSRSASATSGAASGSTSARRSVSTGTATSRWSGPIDGQPRGRVALTEHHEPYRVPMRMTAGPAARRQRVHFAERRVDDLRPRARAPPPSRRARRRDRSARWLRPGRAVRRTARERAARARSSSPLRARDGQQTRRSVTAHLQSA